MLVPELSVPVEPSEQESERPRRSTRPRVMTQKVRDMLPESSVSGLVPDPEPATQSASEVRHPCRVRLIVMEKFQTLRQSFRLVTRVQRTT